MSQLHDDLVAVRQLLTPPERWTKGQERGVFKAPDGTLQDCWCLRGAMIEVAGEKYNARDYAMRQAIMAFTPDHTIILFNDKARHADVLRVLDATIAAHA